MTGSSLPPHVEVDAGASIGNRLDDGLLIASIEPDAAGQFRRPDVLVALALIAMTGHAIIGKNLRAGL